MHVYIEIDEWMDMHVRTALHLLGMVWTIYGVAASIFCLAVRVLHI